MEKSNDDRPRPLKERRNYYDSENRPVPRAPRRDAGRPASNGETPAGYRRPEIGAWVRVGQTDGRVARYTETGFAVDFQPKLAR